MSIILISISLILASIVGMFPAWKKLREDYLPKHIFSAQFVVLIFTYLITVFTYLLTKNISVYKYFEPAGLWFWAGFLAMLISLIYASKKYEIKLNEFFDAMAICFVVIGLSANLILLILLRNINFAYYAGIFLLLFVLYKYVEAHYLKFKWYKSGKIGIGGLSVFTAFFAARTIAGVAFTDIIMLVGRVDFIISAIAAFLSGFAIYNMGESKK